MNSRWQQCGGASSGLPIEICSRLRLYLETPSAKAIKAFWPAEGEIREGFAGPIAHLTSIVNGKELKSWSTWKNAKLLLLWSPTLREHWFPPYECFVGRRSCSKCGIYEKDTLPHQLCTVKTQCGGTTRYFNKLRKPVWR